jgi:hypothetical protein
MGLFGGLGKLVEVSVKVACTPIADVVDVVTGSEAETTSKLLDSAGDSASEIMDKLLD